MTYKRLPDNMPQILRDAGLKVVEVPGWRTRGRPASTGNLDPVGVLCHHTATSKATSTGNLTNLLVNGRADLPGPLCHFQLDRDGTVHIVASGRANHAGRARPSGTVAGGDGNALYWGVEAANSGLGEPWPDKQMDAYVTLCATLCTKVTHNSAQTVRGHRETSVTGKIDPTFNMDAFRVRVAAAMRPEAQPQRPAKKARPKHVREIIKHARAQKKGRNPNSVLRRRMERILDIAKKIRKR